MTERIAPTDEFLDLMCCLVEDQISPQQMERLDVLLCAAPENSESYIDFMLVAKGLRWIGIGRQGNESTAMRCAIEDTQSAADEDGGSQSLVSQRRSSDSCGGSRGAFPVVSQVPVCTTLQPALGYFSSGWPAAYLVATVICGLGLVIGALVHVSTPEQVARQSVPLPSSSFTTHDPRSTTHSTVGRITGMVDCRLVQSPDASGQWSVVSGQKSSESKSTSHQPLATGHLVALGDKFALRSGLMEITYDTGAKVILQGPVTYEVESAAGGYLSVGKLTARVEKRGERTANHDSSLSTIHCSLSTASNPKSTIPNPSLPTAHYPLFTIKTPSATVTDLGTEFGVEVAKSGETTSHVFRGAVQVQASDADAQKEGGSIVLHEGESAQTEKSTGDAGIVVRRISSDSKMFVRRIVRTPKTLDLLDIVAGGNGTGHRRERGIDPSTGMEDPVFIPGWRGGERQYHSSAWNKLIDGVFVPSGGNGPVVVDSAGHAFDGFPHTFGDAWGSIWARAAEVNARVKANGQEKDHTYWVYAMGRGRQFTPNDLGLLGMMSNMGITFNLEAMRVAYQGARPARFRAIVGVSDASGLMPADAVQVADIWVLVDGRPKLSRTNLRPQDGTVNVDIALGSNDRFLTLATTYGGNERNFDWVVFGDPVLEMALEEEQEVAPDGKEKP